MVFPEAELKVTNQGIFFRYDVMQLVKIFLKFLRKKLVGLLGNNYLGIVDHHFE